MLFLSINRISESGVKYLYRNKKHKKESIFPNTLYMGEIQTHPYV